MRPSFSIICFTTLSGTGYGLLFLIGIVLVSGSPIGSSNALLVALCVGFVLTSVGLLASLAHLGRPLRAWRAFSQWRSSWLSREGIASLVTVPVMAIVGFVLCNPPHGRFTLRALGLLLAACCMVTVTCTARIYSSLPPIRAWHNRFTLPGYLLLGLYGGAVWFCAITASVAAEADTMSLAFSILLANALVIAPASALFKRAYWRHIDALAPITTGVATGLDHLGDASSFEQPHTEENYLTREMGFALARKHSATLRALAFWTMLAAPLFSVAAALTFGGGVLLTCVLWLVVLAGTAAIFVERWLFFAEATHSVKSYYN